MIGLDTNVLVRYLIVDDAAQTEKVSQLINQHKDEMILIDLLTIQETEWVLRTVYQLSKTQMILLFKALLESYDVMITNEEVLEEALIEFENSNADFNDCLMTARYLNLNCECMFTFDKKASSIKGVRLVS